MLIAVSLEKNEILAAWWIGAIISASIVAAFGVLLIFAWRMFAREIRARNEAERRNVEQAKELAVATSKHEEVDAALRAKEAQFQSIMDHAPMMVSLKDLSGRFTFLNRAYVAFEGQSEESILGRTIGELRGKEHAEKMESHDRAVIEARRAMQWEITLPKPGGPRTVMAVKFPVYDNAGNIASVGAILVDITEQKRAESHLAQSQRMESLGQLTGGIAHDFNNLLTAILLNADVLASALDDKLRPLAEAVRMAAERGADLTRRLLAFGRRQILEPRPTDVRELLAGMEPLMHRTLGAHIEIESRHAEDLWFATVDPSQLENAVLNLAVNARDAMPEGGRLTIETANVEFDDEQTEAFPGSKAGQYVMIAVGDTGRGMSAEVGARAFEPFFTTKDVGKGTGPGAQHGLRLREPVRRTCADLFGDRARHGGAALSAALDDGARSGGSGVGAAGGTADRQGNHSVRRGRSDGAPAHRQADRRARLRDPDGRKCHRGACAGRRRVCSRSSLH